MAQFKAELKITTPTEEIMAIKTDSYVEVFNIKQEISGGVNNNTLIPLLITTSTAAQSAIKDAKALVIKNNSVVSIEIQIKTNEWADASPDTVAGDSYQAYLLPANDFIFLPNLRQANYRTDVNSMANAFMATDLVPDGNMYLAVDNPEEGDPQLVAEALDGTETAITVDDGSFFEAGDIIRVENEIMEVTSAPSNTINVIRGTHGSTAATHADDSALRYAFFNQLHDFDAFSVTQTDASGRLKVSNFFGLARTEGVAEGIVPGSFSGQFYKAGFQEVGLSGIKASTESGLTASTIYYFTINVDATGTIEVAFTTSTNTKFGGSDGVIQKIQDAINSKFYVAGNLFEKKVVVGIVNGDIRFTSGQHLSTSAIALTAGTSGSDTTTEIFAQVIGRFPLAPEDAVAARIPSATLASPKSGVVQSNLSDLMYDDGHGRILGMAKGTIDYATGAINIHSAPANAEFTVSAAYGSAQSGTNDYAATNANSIRQISARSCNQKINGIVEIIAIR